MRIYCFHTPLLASLKHRPWPPYLPLFDSYPYRFACLVEGYYLGYFWLFLFSLKFNLILHILYIYRKYISKHVPTCLILDTSAYIPNSIPSHSLYILQVFKFVFVKCKFLFPPCFLYFLVFLYENLPCFYMIKKYMFT